MTPMFESNSNALVAFSPRHLLAVIVQHGHIPSVIRAAQRDNLVLPMSLLAQEFVDLIIEVANLIIRQTSFIKQVTRTTGSTTRFVAH